MDRHGCGDQQPAKTFHLIPKLPDELRLMIWEHTWPEPRMIEGVLCVDKEAKEYTETTNLRIAGPLSALLEEDFGARLLEGEHAEECPPPVALHVCHESRKHTLSQYHIVESIAGAFYLNPHRDVLWLSMDLTDKPECVQGLVLYHERELNTFTTILVEELEWIVTRPLVWGDFDEFTDELMESDTEDLTEIQGQCTPTLNAHH